MPYLIRFLDDVLPLSTVVGTQASSAEVIRVFIASLHLANSGNVELGVGEDASLLYRLKSLDLRSFTE